MPVARNLNALLIAADAAYRTGGLAGVAVPMSAALAAGSATQLAAAIGASVGLGRQSELGAVLHTAYARAVADRIARWGRLAEQCRDAGCAPPAAQHSSLEEVRLLATRLRRLRHPHLQGRRPGCRCRHRARVPAGRRLQPRPGRRLRAHAHRPLGGLRACRCRHAGCRRPGCRGPPGSGLGAPRVGSHAAVCAGGRAGAAGGRLLAGGRRAAGAGGPGPRVSHPDRRQ